MGTGRALARQRAQSWPALLTLLPPALLATGVILELSLPTHYGFTALLSAGVVLAALSYRFLLGAGFAVLSFAALVILHFFMGDLYQRQIAGSLFNMAVVALVAMLVASARNRAEQRLSRIRKVADAAQLALLRPLPKQLGTVRMAGFYQAADDEALVGGDLYSCRSTDHGVRVLVGDVRGKGIGATETVATVVSAFREAAMVCPTLPEVAERLEAAMALDRADALSGASRGPGLADAASEELFATAVLLEFPPDGTSVRVLDRGHPPVIRVNGQGSAPLETDYGLPLGLAGLGIGPGPEPRSFALERSELLVAYSDGITEARNRDGVFYPLLQRLDEQYEARDAEGGPEIDPTEIVDFIQRDVQSWARKLSDDVVVLVLQPSADDPPR